MRITSLGGSEGKKGRVLGGMAVNGYVIDQYEREGIEKGVHK